MQPLYSEIAGLSEASQLAALHRSRTGSLSPTARSIVPVPVPFYELCCFRMEQRLLSNCFGLNVAELVVAEASAHRTKRTPSHVLIYYPAGFVILEHVPELNRKQASDSFALAGEAPGQALPRTRTPP